MTSMRIVQPDTEMAPLSLGMRSEPAGTEFLGWAESLRSRLKSWIRSYQDPQTRFHHMKTHCYPYISGHLFDTGKKLVSIALKVNKIPTEISIKPINGFVNPLTNIYNKDPMPLLPICYARALGRAETSSYQRFRCGVSPPTRFFTNLPKSIAISPAISAMLKSSPAT